MRNIIHGLSNEDYHHGEPYCDYISSTALKHYLKSPAAFKFAIAHPQPETDAMRFGSLFHDAMAALAKRNDSLAALDEWRQALAIFEPPVNEKTGKPYGPAALPYKDAYACFLSANSGQQICSREDAAMVHEMVRTILDDCGQTSNRLRKLLRQGEPEVSFFCTYEGCKFKFRPDLLVKRGKFAGMYDYKTVADNDLSEEAVNRIILKYNYHISACHYQFMYHHLTGTWLPFILILVSKSAPHDSLMIDMRNYCYGQDDWGMVVPGPATIEYKRILDMHIACTCSNHWPGAEIAIRDSGSSALVPQPPRYYISKFIDNEDYE